MYARQVIVRDVSVRGTHERFVEGVDLVAPAGEVTVHGVDPGAAQVALALAIGGRVDLLTGSVTIDGSSTRSDLQRLTRLVDVPDVTAPDDALPLRAVVAEELALAERPSSRKDVAAFLADRGLAGLSGRRWESLPPGLRTPLLLELGSWHPRVRVVVLAGPDRHGGDPREWFEAARAVADQGLAVIVLCAPAIAASLVPDVRTDATADATADATTDDTTTATAVSA